MVIIKKITEKRKMSEEFIEKTIIEKDENGNDVEIVVKEYPNIPVVVVENEGE